MNANKVISITLMSIFALILAGCAGEDNTAAKQNMAQTQEKAVTQQTPADITALQGAMDQKDPKLCDKIADLRTRENCKTALESQKIAEDALKAMDPVLCDKITIKDLADACRMQIEVAKNKQKNDQERNDALSQDLANRDSIVASGEITKCKTLKEENNRTDCELNILANKAIQEKDITVCDQGSTDDIKKICRSMVGSVNEAVTQE
jgi:hypothetical protein